MKNSKLTKLVALASVLLVSVATLAGSTVAWFTDTEEVVNTIQSGDLDVELQYKVVESDGKLSDNWLEVEDNKQIFKENALYEPGYTEFVLLKVRNAGNLALQYKLSVDATNTVVGASAGQKANGRGDYDVPEGEEIYLSDHLKLAAFPIVTEAATTEADADTAVENQLYTDGKVTRSKVRELIGDTVTDGADGTTIPYITQASRGLWTKKSETVKDQVYEALINSVVSATADGGTATYAATPIQNIELWPETADKKGETYDIYGLVLYMPEETTNEANNRKVDDQGAIINPEIQLGIKLEAAQVVEQADSFDDDYDAYATYDGTVVSSYDATNPNFGNPEGSIDGFVPGMWVSEDKSTVIVYNARQLYSVTEAGNSLIEEWPDWTKVKTIILGDNIDMSDVPGAEGIQFYKDGTLDLKGKTLDMGSNAYIITKSDYKLCIEDSAGNGKIVGEAGQAIIRGHDNGGADVEVVGGSYLGGVVESSGFSGKNVFTFSNAYVQELWVNNDADVVIGNDEGEDSVHIVNLRANEDEIAVSPRDDFFTPTVTINNGRVDELSIEDKHKEDSEGYYANRVNAFIKGGSVGNITIAEANSTITIDGGTITGNITITAGTVKVKNELTAIHAKLTGYAQDISESGYTIYTAATASA